jgi:hypothetical protein
MRAAPAVSLTVRPSPHWQAALALLAAAAVASTVLWAWRRGDAASGGAAAAVAALALHALRAARRRPALGLRWDGQSWWLSETAAAAAGEEPREGELELALDLGSWLLLRFRPHDPARRKARWRWLPLQRAGLEADWHALRCALYSPRPAAEPTAAGGRRRS